MGAILEIIDGGLATSLQDAGRLGFRHIGMTVSGALDIELLQCVNALLGNQLFTAALEMRGSGPRLVVKHGSVRLAIAGAVTGQITLANGISRPLHPWQTFTIKEGDKVRVACIKSGVAYLGIAGGFACPAVMNSLSTYSRCQIGGFNGRLLTAAMQVESNSNLNSQQIAKETIQQTAWQRLENTAEFCTIRVIYGPQQDYFTAVARELLCQNLFQVSSDADRMGIRLKGEKLEHESSKGSEIISDGITPGAIQVPADGQAIILLADCQTVGGYPKIATVISADLPLLGQLLPNNKVKFIAVSLDQAQIALQQQQKLLQQWINNISEYLATGYIDEESLYQQNLISGVVDANMPNI